MRDQIIQEFLAGHSIFALALRYGHTQGQIEAVLRVALSPPPVVQEEADCHPRALRYC